MAYLTLAVLGEVKTILLQCDDELISILDLECFKVDLQLIAEGQHSLGVLVVILPAVEEHTHFIEKEVVGLGFLVVVAQPVHLAVAKTLFWFRKGRLSLLPEFLLR
jgi:hypothetical protein